MCVYVYDVFFLLFYHAVCKKKKMYIGEFKNEKIFIQRSIF